MSKTKNHTIENLFKFSSKNHTIENLFKFSSKNSLNYARYFCLFEVLFGFFLPFSSSLSPLSSSSKMKEKSQKFLSNKSGTKFKQLLKIGNNPDLWMPMRLTQVRI